MTHFLTTFALCLAATGAMADTKTYDRAEEVLTRGILPAAESLAWMLDEVEDDIPLGRLNIVIGLSPLRPETTSVGFACPLEFNCDGVEAFFVAVGGDCVTDPEQGIFCTGPEGPDVPDIE